MFCTETPFLIGMRQEKDLNKILALPPLLAYFYLLILISWEALKWLKKKIQ